MESESYLFAPCGSMGADSPPPLMPTKKVEVTAAYTVCEPDDEDSTWKYGLARGHLVDVKDANNIWYQVKLRSLTGFGFGGYFDP
jgi:hypothetical protein